MKSTNRKLSVAFLYAAIVTKLDTMIKPYADTILSVWVAFMVSQTKKLPGYAEAIISVGAIGNMPTLKSLLTIAMTIRIVALLVIVLGKSARIS